MKRITSILSLLAFLLILSYGISFCQEVDPSGTWEGTTEVPEEAELDQITLVLEKINGEYSGTFTDSLGFAEDAELKDIEFKDNTLTQVRHINLHPPVTKGISFRCWSLLIVHQPLPGKRNPG